MVDYVIKLVIVGDSLTGKSSILKRSCENNFSPYYEATIGVDFVTKISKMEDGSIIKTHIWDTAGQKCFSNIIKSYYRGTAGIIYVFDKSRKSTFDNIKYWMEEVYENGNNNTPVLLIGNKIDKRQQVSTEDATKFASSNGMLYIETSASKNINTDNFLDIFIKNIYNNMDENSVGIRKSYESKSLSNQKRNDDTVCCCKIS